MQLRVTPTASADLRQIVIFSAVRWDHEQAERYMEQLIAGCDLLLQMPHIGQRVQRGVAGLRKYRIKQHIVLYAVHDAEVWIFRFLHHRRNVRDHIPKA